MATTPFNYVQYGDSRTFGAQDAGNLLGFARPTVTYGTNFTSKPNAVLSGGSGSGGAVLADYDHTNGEAIIYTILGGTGYTAGNMPSVAITGGGGATPPDYSWPDGPAGGCTPDVKSYFAAHGFPQANLLNYGINGEKITAVVAGTFTAKVLYRLLSTALAVTGANSGVIVVDELINSALQGDTFANVQTSLTLAVNYWVSLGAPVILDKSFGVIPDYGGTGVGTTANNLLQTYFPILDNLVNANPGKVFSGANLYAAVGAHPEYLADGLHPNRAGDVAIGALKGAAHVPILNALFGQPLNLFVSKNTALQPVLTWGPQPGVTVYHVLRSPDEVNWTRIAEVSPPSTVYTDTNEQSGTNFYAIVAR